MSLSLLVGVACAVLFFRAAQYERMSPWVWAIASIGLHLAVGFLSPSILLALLAQAALFIVMWWYNAKRTPSP